MASADRGFTLVEVLVALVVTALLLVILIDGAQTTARIKRSNLEHAEATRIGTAVLAKATASNEPAVGMEGAEAGLHWVVREQPLMSDPRGFYQLVEVKVDILNRDDRRIESFVTRKLRKVSRL